MTAPFLLMTLLGAGAAGAAAPSADLIVRNGRIWTVDRGRPTAAALAVIGERIVAVGGDAQIEPWRGPSTRVIDARGRRVLPGFNDSHIHLVQGGEQLESVQLKDAASPEELARRIGERARATPQGEWILGGDWDEQLWSPAELPRRELIDPFTADTPVFVIRYDGHVALANSRALGLAGITRDTPDPPNGAILRDREGNPTGILKVSAMDLVRRIIPPLSGERRRRAAKLALEHAASLGVTSAQDMRTSAEDLALFMELAEKGELTTRLYAAPLETEWQDLAKLGIRRGFGSPYLRLGGLKGYVDGSLGSATALFFQPYHDAPGNRGLLTAEFTPLERARERLRAADAAGLQLCLHAIGDHGISLTLGIFEEIRRANGPADRRFRIEHAQHVDPEDFARFKALEVVASVQPYHAIDDGRWAEKRIGAERAKTTYPFRTFLDNGVRLALGTDWNGAPLDPMLTLYAATTRATLDGRHPDGWVPEQKISLAEAIEAYTVGSAYAEFQEHSKGSLSPGKLADLVILSDDIFELPPAALRDVKVELTLVGGKTVYQRTP